MRKEKKYHYIYKTTNLKNGRYYIGLHSTDNLDDGYLGSGTYLRRAINKYGKENFKQEILEFYNTRKEVIEREKEIISLLEVINPECMNLKIGGQGDWQIFNDGYWKGKTRSEESKQKMSEAHIGKVSGMIGKFHTDETRQKIREKNIGKTVGEETRQKMSEVHKGHIVSETTRKKISKSNIGNFHSEESKQKMSKSHTGKIFSEEHKENLRIAGANPSEETRYKRGSGKRGTKLSDETKNKIGSANSKPQKMIKCPHCEKSGGISNMKRYHFNNCNTI